MNARRRIGCLALALLAACSDPNAPAPTRAPAESPFDVAFVDRTGASGIEFVHSGGASTSKLLPETMGSGVALLDCDGDGHLDVFAVDCGVLGGEQPMERKSRSRLYRGRGDLTFEDVTGAANAGLDLYGMGASVADFDGDGDEDIYVTSLAGNALLVNDGGRFVELAQELGVRGGHWRERGGMPHADWSTASAWFDADRDGDLDLFVGNYVQWTPGTEIFTTLDGVTKAITTPDRYPGLPCRLFLNEGAAGFDDATERAGLLEHLGKALGIALWDFDRDGALDVVVANDTQPNFLFENRSQPGAPKFVERGVELGLAYDANGRARAGMGIDVADYANNGVESVAIGNFSGEALSLYRREGERGFKNAAAQLGLDSVTVAPLTFGLAFADVDLDGRQDLVLANGHIEPEIERFHPGTNFAQPAMLLRALDGGGFVDASSAAGVDFIRARVGRGLAVGDLDGDGDLDVVISTSGGPLAVLENRAQQIRPRHFLRVELRGKAPNTRAIGAMVTLRAGGVSQRRLARTGSSYLSSSESTLTFGLGSGTAPAIDELRVRWPSGAETVEHVDGIDRTLRIEER